MSTEDKIQTRIDLLLDIYERRLVSGNPQTRNRMLALIRRKLQLLADDEHPWDEIEYELMEIETSCELRYNNSEYNSQF